MTMTAEPTKTMADEAPATKKCAGQDCPNEAGSLQCPTCLKLGIKGSFFCSQDCFKKNWVRKHALRPFTPERSAVSVLQRKSC
jgi:hypothetical protein